MWLAVLVGSAGCYALKLAGLSMPRRVLGNPRTCAAAIQRNVRATRAAARTTARTPQRRSAVVR